MKYVVAGVWLAGSLVAARSPTLRRMFSYAGSVIALVHICALTVGLLDQRWNRRPVESGVPIGGFLIGIAVGVVLGLVLGVFVSRTPALYWVVQLTVVAFLIFLPLFRL
jgi:hypothetical protein